MYRRLLHLLGMSGEDHPCQHASRSQVCVQCGVCHC